MCDDVEGVCNSLWMKVDDDSEDVVVVVVEEKCGCGKYEKIVVKK